MSRSGRVEEESEDAAEVTVRVAEGSAASGEDAASAGRSEAPVNESSGADGDATADDPDGLAALEAENRRLRAVLSRRRAERQLIVDRYERLLAAARERRGNDQGRRTDDRRRRPTPNRRADPRPVSVVRSLLARAKRLLRSR